MWNILRTKRKAVGRFIRFILIVLSILFVIIGTKSGIIYTIQDVDRVIFTIEEIEGEMRNIVLFMAKDKPIAYMDINGISFIQFIREDKVL